MTREDPTRKVTFESWVQGPAVNEAHLVGRSLLLGEKAPAGRVH